MDILRDNDIWFHCDGCGKSRKFTYTEFIGLFGKDADLRGIKQRGKCSDCGGRVSQVTLSFVGNTGIK